VCVWRGRGRGGRAVGGEWGGAGGSDADGRRQHPIHHKAWVFKAVRFRPRPHLPQHALESGLAGICRMEWPRVAWGTVGAACYSDAGGWLGETLISLRESPKHCKRFQPGGWHAVAHHLTAPGPAETG
jgi:hypothetical protein